MFEGFACTGKLRGITSLLALEWYDKESLMEFGLSFVSLETPHKHNEVVQRRRKLRRNGRRPADTDLASPPHTVDTKSPLRDGAEKEIFNKVLMVETENVVQEPFESNTEVKVSLVWMMAIVY